MCLAEDLATLAHHRTTINFAQSSMDAVQCSIDTNRSGSWTVAIAPDAVEALAAACRSRVSSLHLSRRALPETRARRPSHAASKASATADIMASLGL